jgi:hypothetical protein
MEVVVSYAFKPPAKIDFLLRAINGVLLTMLVIACSAKAIGPIPPISQAATQHSPSATAPPAFTAADAEFIAAMLAP